MAKYSFKFKMNVIIAYQTGEGGYGYLANKFGISDKSIVKLWVSNYNAFGKEGLLRKKQYNNYTFDFKLNMVQYYLTTEISYKDLAIQQNISNPATIANWVSKFRKHGAESLSNKKGRPSKMKLKEKKNDVERINKQSSDSKQVEELKQQVLELQIENAYLKRIEETAPRGNSKNEVTARIIHGLRRLFKLKDILAVLNFAKSTYMYWQKRFDRNNPDTHIEEEIVAIRKKHKNYGYRRIHRELLRRSFVINKKKVQRIIQKLKLQVISFGRKSRKYSSYKGRVGRIAPNRINRRFNTSVKHQKITTDTTEFKYYEVNKKGIVQVKKLYLDPFMDLFNSEIISYGISPNPSAKNIMDALAKAIEKTNDCKHRRTFHSDQGWGYQMKAYSKELKENKIYQSMSRKGNCHDNSSMENFFGIMKQEMFYGNIFYSYDELKNEIDKYIKYYNEERIKEKLGWLSPVEYREYLSAA